MSKLLRFITLSTVIILVWAFSAQLPLARIGQQMKIETVAQQLLFATVRVETGQGVGTAFIFSYQVKKGEMLFLVTNKHVVAGAQSGQFFFTLSDGEKPLIGERFDVRVNRFEQGWHGHPNPEVDITVMPLAPLLNKIQQQGKKVFIRAIPRKLLPTEEQLESFDAIEQVIFIGYPVGMYDQVNLIPITRTGMTATPLQLDYNGRPSFLIDASVFPGSS